MIKLRDLEKSYTTGYGKTFVLRRINLDIREGEFVTIMGPSGAGSRPCWAYWACWTATSRASFTFSISPSHQLKPRQRVELNKQHIGFVFQSYHLLDDMTVYENLDLPLSYRNVSRKERQSIVADVLDRFHIVAKKDLFPNQLSGGQQQLVAVARAIVAGSKTDSGRRADRQPALSTGQGNHGVV